MALSTTFLDFAQFIANENPYAHYPVFPGSIGEEGGPGVLTVQADGTDPWHLHWDFREPAAGIVDNQPFGPLDMANYRIARAAFIPTSYRWTENRPEGQPEVELFANVIIGYTVPTGSTAHLPLRPFADDPTGGDTGVGYIEALAEILERRFPFDAQPRLQSERREDGTLSGITMARSWLEGYSARSGAIFQISNMLMTLHQRQQCLYWDGPKRVPAMPPAPTPASAIAGKFDPNRVANYQITKAFRIGYEYGVGGDVVSGQIVVGFNGGGDA